MGNLEPSEDRGNAHTLGMSTCVQRDLPLEVPDVQDRLLQIATNPREAPSIPTRHRKVLAGATEIATVEVRS